MPKCNQWMRAIIIAAKTGRSSLGEGVKVKWTAFIFIFFLFGCTAGTPRFDEPDATYASAKDIDVITACLVEVFTQEMKTGHTIRTVSPMKIFEVAPVLNAAIGSEDYFAVVSSKQNGSLIELKARGLYARRLNPIVAMCV
jgi:hypothetical protein